MALWNGPLEKIDDYRWQIPKSYKQGMRVPGIIYADADMVKQIRQEQGPEQVANVAFLPGTSIPIQVNTVNGGNPLGTDAQNPQFFNNNDIDDGGQFADRGETYTTAIFYHNDQQRQAADIANALSSLYKRTSSSSKVHSS